MSLTNFFNWATPLGALSDTLTRGRLLGIGDGCIMRQQGQCPGKEFCADCAWNEGCMADGTLGSPVRRPR